MAQIEIPLSEEQMAALAELARKRHVSVPELVQEGVANLLRTAEACDGAEQRRRALAVAGRFRSGYGDLSRRHDDYLAGGSET